MTKILDAAPLADVQAHPDTRRVPISRVGVQNVRFPISVRDRRKTAQHTIANIDMSVDLPHDFKGTHMSRFMEILNSYDDEISVQALPAILRTMRERLNAETAHLGISFPYFVEKAAPVTGSAGLLSYDCAFDASSGAEDDFILTVKIPVTTLCPCSREISARGAHNQPQHRHRQDALHGAAVDRGCRGAGRRIGLLRALSGAEARRREVGHRARVRQSRFVEDLVREVTLRLRALHQVTWFSVHVINFESIHEHDAYAQVEEPARTSS